MKQRLPHLIFGVVVCGGVLFAVYAPVMWSGPTGYAVAGTSLIPWAYYVGTQGKNKTRRHHDTV